LGKSGKDVLAPGKVVGLGKGGWGRRAEGGGRDRGREEAIVAGTRERGKRSGADKLRQKPKKRENPHFPGGHRRNRVVRGA